MINYETLIREAVDAGKSKYIHGVAVQWAETGKPDMVCPKVLIEQCIADAVIAAIKPHLRPADDNEPLTPEWLLANGFEDDRRDKEFDGDGYWRLMPSGEVWVVFEPDGDVYFDVNSRQINQELATRGSVRKLIELFTGTGGTE